MTGNYYLWFLSRFYGTCTAYTGVENTPWHRHIDEDLIDYDDTSYRGFYMYCIVFDLGEEILEL